MTPRIQHNVDELKSRLRVFTRLASSLRNAPIRNLSQLETIEGEIDNLRRALGYESKCTS